MALWKQNLLTCALTAAVAYGNTLLVKAWTSRDDGATAENIIENQFPGIPRSNVFTLCWMSERSANLCSLQGIFFIILERAKNRRGLNQVNKVDGPFL